MNVRLMEINDVEAVAKLEKQYFSIPWSKEAIIESFNKDNYIFVVAIASDVIGYAALYTALDEGDITNVVVAQDYRKQGVGKEMVSFLLKNAKEKAVKNVLLEVRYSNVAAINLYKKLGFEIRGTRKGFYSKPTEDAYIMGVCL